MKTASDLRQRVEEYQAELKAKGSHVAWSSETGPVGIALILDVVAALETLEQRVEALEGRG